MVDALSLKSIHRPLQFSLTVVRTKPTDNRSIALTRPNMSH
jgi:hypothetical protein